MTDQQEARRALQQEFGQGAGATFSRVQIISRKHPHFEEYGRFTGKIIAPLWGGGDMAEVKLENCRHGTDRCFVSKGDVRRVAER